MYQMKKTIRQRWYRLYDKVMNQISQEQYDVDECEEILEELLDLADRCLDAHERKDYFSYLRVLYEILHINLEYLDRLAYYESVVGELLRCVEREYTYFEEEIDLAAFGKYVQASIHMYHKEYVKAMETLEDVKQYAEEEMQEEAEDYMLTGWEYKGLLILEESYLYCGYIEKGVELGFWLLECMLDDKVLYVSMAEWKREGEEKVKRLVQTCVQLLISDLVNVCYAYHQYEIVASMIEKYAFHIHLLQYNGESDLLWRIYSTYIKSMLRLNKKIQPDRLEVIEEAFTKAEDVMNFQEILYFDYLQSRYYLAKAKGQTDMAYLEHISEEIISRNEVDDYSVLVQSMYTYLDEGLEDKAVKQAGDILSYLIHSYRIREYISDNEKAERYMAKYDAVFKGAYYVVNSHVKAESKIEYSVNYKHAISEMIKLRNQYENQKITNKKMHLDYKTYQDLVERIPEETAVLDYLCVSGCNLDDEISKYNAPEKTGLFMTAIIKRKDGNCEIYSKEVLSCKELFDRIDKLTDILQNPQKKYRKSAECVSDILLKPFEKQLQDVKNIILSPDRSLANLPFEILFEVSSDSFTFENIVYMQSLRSLFEVWHELKKYEGKACVIGNPAFWMDEKPQNGNAKIRGTHTVWDLSGLPYSGYEAVLIAGISDGKCYIGKRAKKSTVSAGFLYLHIATHGIQENEESNTWYSSSLAFSGILDYEKNKIEQADCGNGLLTAEEISHLHMEGTELVTLSACQSGITRYSMMEQQTGLHIAFGASGVKYIISSLWEVDDLAAAVLMGFFYQGIEQGLQVPRALSLAKEKIRKMTVHTLREQLKEDGALTNTDFTDVIAELENFPGDYQLYRSPYYWGSFVCYQYKM